MNFKRGTLTKLIMIMNDSDYELDVQKNIALFIKITRVHAE